MSAALLCIHQPHTTNFQSFRESPEGKWHFDFVSFDKKRKLHLKMAEAEPKPMTFPLMPCKHLSKEPSFEEYLKKIEIAIDHLQQLDSGKIVLSRIQRIALDLNPFQSFLKLKDAYPAACVYLFYHPRAGVWLGATPETLLQRKSRQIESASLAGTKKVGEKRPFSAKEYEEQELVSKFIESVYSSDPGVENTRRGKLEEKKAGNLIHLHTAISGRINARFHPESFLDKLHPTPAVAGVPLNQALQFLTAHEAHDREFYSGYLGLTNGGQSHYFVNLRCMQIFKGEVILYAGGGITKDSDPTDEWFETSAKMNTLLNVLGPTN